MKTCRILSDSLKSIPGSLLRCLGRIYDKSYLITFLSYHVGPSYRYFCFQLSNLKRQICMKTKMKLIASLKIWAVIYPSITLFLYLFGEALSVLPLYQRTFLLTISLVPWIVFAGVPFV